MKVKIDVPIVFRIAYANKNGARLDECKIIERATSQVVSIELPTEISGLIANLAWAETIGLRVAITAQIEIDLDNVSIKQQGSERKGLLARLHW